jgi:uncharacterized protein
MAIERGSTGQMIIGQPVSEPDADSGGVTLVLSRRVKPGHEQEFEEILHRLADGVGRQPGHIDLTVLRPASAGPADYTLISRFTSKAAADAWVESEPRARLVAEADLHAAGELRTRYLSGLEDWLSQLGAAVMITPARWKVALLSAIGILPILEVVNYTVAPLLVGLPIWSRALIVTPVLIPFMQYVIMPVLTKLTRGFLYPPTKGLT